MPNEHFAINHLNSGYFHYTHGNFGEAWNEFTLAMEVKPYCPEAWNNAGVILCRFKSYREAIKYFNTAIEMKGDYAEAWNNKGHALFDLGEYENALKAFDKAIEIKGNYAEAWSNKGVTLDIHGQSGKALEAYNKAIKIKPKSPLVLMNLMILLNNIDKEKCLELTQQIHEIKKNLPSDSDKYIDQESKKLIKQIIDIIKYLEK